MIRLLAVLLFLASPVLAVEPNEMLADPALEARARDLSTGLRCPICRNESIDESNATLARDLRIILRERLTAGDTDAQAVDYLVQRYGEYVLLNPRANGVNWVLWGAGPVMFLMALGIGARVVRRRADPAGDLSADEKTRLSEILKN